ncbi:BTAD domain-containing putative transcriptional regulator [Streptosporangium sp. NPDC050855]|uniref:AfsR/SARP family transcriptional regulator n=1 Tax=Streptosporangium sp. NPDC050855 TaxID=3366194 RepID=UPI0037B5146E
MLLAHLALNANRPVSTGQLIETLWPQRPPASATANLQTYVWRLRLRLPKTVAGQGLRTREGGYSLAVAPADVDAHRFVELIDQAARARRGGSVQTALDLLAEADALWRGDPLEGLPCAAAWEPELGRLAESRLTAIEEWLSLQVLLGRYDPAIARFAALLAEHPYRERLWQRYLLALDGAGRRAEALEAYSAVRKRLLAELGVEPGPELRAVQAAILNGESAQASESEIAPADGPPPPRQLPADIPDFIGREDAVRELELLLRTDRTTPALVVLSGPPGIGKTALATHVAHRLADRFPDGQFFADLAGTCVPRAPSEVLAGFLHALGVTGDAVPAGLDRRAALFRSRLSGRRVLLLLDDASTARQVRPLLPADAACAVVVTTRARLPELAGAEHLEPTVFTEHEAERLLAAIAGPDRICAEPAEAAAIVRCCGYLPLAVRIAGARLAGRRAWSLRTLHDRLSDESNRLDELQAGDLDVRASYEPSLRRLRGTARQAFCRLALLGARDFPGWVLDALLDRTGTHDVLDALVDANLLSLVGLDAVGQLRYRLHDLLRCYAAEVLSAESPQERRPALERVLSALSSLARAAAKLPPASGATTGSAAGWRLDAEVTARLVADPLRWFAAERELLTGAVQLAAQAGLDETAWRLMTAIPHHDPCGRHDARWCDQQSAPGGGPEPEAGPRRPYC